jgi:hypothetical protein
MFWLRLLLLGLACLAAGCCSTSGSGYGPVGYGGYAAAGSGYAAPSCGCGQ